MEQAKIIKKRSGPPAKQYKGVSQYKKTGLFESHVWITAKNNQRGYQRHLGSFFEAETAAKVFDLATVRLRGFGAELNSPAARYKNDPFLKKHSHLSIDEFLCLLREHFAVPSKSRTANNRHSPNRRSKKALAPLPAPASQSSSHSSARKSAAAALDASSAEYSKGSSSKKYPAAIQLASPKEERAGVDSNFLHRFAVLRQQQQQEPFSKTLHPDPLNSSLVSLIAAPINDMVSNSAPINDMVSNSPVNNFNDIAMHLQGDTAVAPPPPPALLDGDKDAEEMMWTSHVFVEHEHESLPGDMQPFDWEIV